MFLPVARNFCCGENELAVCHIYLTRHSADTYYMLFQILLVQVGGFVFSCKPLTAEQWMWCVFFGVSTLVWAQVSCTVISNELLN